MFTGIIESVGKLREILVKGGNISFWIESSISQDLKVDQSVSHSGACLTIEEVETGAHRVTAIEETLEKTTLASWQKGSLVNLERCLTLNSRLDGHMVQGHVDTTGTCIAVKEKDGSWELEFDFPKKFTPLIIDKGSVAINGISLTAFSVKKKSFRVAIIPYTYDHTNIHQIKEGDKVNLEFDMLGKYVLKNLYSKGYL